MPMKPLPDTHQSNADTADAIECRIDGIRQRLCDIQQELDALGKELSATHVDMAINALS